MARTPSTPPVGSAQARYAALSPDRESFLERARRNSALTDPSLFPYGTGSMAGAATGSQGQDLIDPWTSFGAYALTNLTSKLTLVLFTPGQAFLKLGPSRKVLQGLLELEDTERGQLKTAIALGLAGTVREMVDCIAQDGDDTIHTLAIKRILVGGTHGFEHLEDGRLRSIPLDRFVCLRDKRGDLLEFVVLDPMAWATLPEDIQLLIKDQGHPGDAASTHPEKNIQVYTHGRLKGGKWEVYQETWGVEVPGSRATYAKDACPFDFAGINFLEGENYSRAYVDLYAGDLQYLDGGTEIITEGSAAAALYVRLVRPGGVTSKKALAEARNGDVITGDREDVTIPDGNKGIEFQQLSAQLDRTVDRLGRGFLLNSSVQRNGDRVTREEIRFVAQELQDALGGFFTVLVTSYQAPYARKKLMGLQRSGRMTKLPKDQVNVTILTGAAALGRNAQLQALDAFVAGPQTPTAQPAPIHWDEYYNRRAVLLDIDIEGLVLTKEEIAANQQQEQQNQLIQQTAPEVVRQVGTGINQSNRIDAEAAMAEQGAPA